MVSFYTRNEPCIVWHVLSLLTDKRNASPNGDIVIDESPNNDAESIETPNGDAANGQTSNGEAANGETSTGESSNGEDASHLAEIGKNSSGAGPSGTVLKTPSTTSINNQAAGKSFSKSRDGTFS